MANFRRNGSACFVVGLLLAAACSAGGGGGSASSGGSDNGGSSATAGSATGGGSKASGGDASGGSGSTTSGGGGNAGNVTGGSGGAATGGGGNGGGGSGGANAGKPNIVVVLLDDMGFADLGSYGSEIRTPNIDSLAKGGTRFRNFHVTPRCSPTRMALLTGLYTQQAAVMPGASLPPLRSDNNVTLPEMLRDAGYRTYMAGKWHLGGDADQVPAARGFDHVFGFGPQGAGAEASKWDKTAYGFVSKGNAIPARTYGDKPGDFYQADAIGDYALDYLNYGEQQKDDKPFFMYLAFNAPHFPVQAPRDMVLSAPAAGGKSYEEIYGQGWNALRNQRYQNMLSQGVLDATFGLSPQESFMTPVQEIPLWSALTNPQKADLTRKMGLYAASIEAVDKAVGRVIAHLKSQQEFDNTLIFVLSDNGGNYEGGVVGTAFGKPDPLTGDQLANMGQPNQQMDHVQVGGGWASVENTPFRFFKHYTHGGGVRSPLVFSWPARTAQPGGWTNQVAHVIDLAPTILDAAGVTQPSKFAGHAVLPFEGTSLVNTVASTTDPTPRKLGFEHETNRAWIDGKFKMIVRHENSDTVELYNLETDPSELNDLAKAMPKKTQDMVTAWNDWAKRVGVPAERLLKVP